VKIVIFAYIRVRWEWYTMCIQPKSFLGIVEVNEKAPELWGCKDGDGERPLLHQSKDLHQDPHWDND